MGGLAILRLDLTGRVLVVFEIVPEVLSYIKLDYDTAMKAAAASSDDAAVPMTRFSSSS